MNEELQEHYAKVLVAESANIGAQLQRIADCLERVEASEYELTRVATPEPVAPKKKESLIPCPLALWMVFCIFLSVLAVLAAWGGR